MAIDDPLEAGLRALRQRDLSRGELVERLAARGFDECERDSALETLVRTGLVDDVRFAEGRARSLAERGTGDAMIRDALQRAGVAPDVVEEALATLEPETERALRIAERRGSDEKTARYLARKGFSTDVIGAIVAGSANEGLG